MEITLHKQQWPDFLIYTHHQLFLRDPEMFHKDKILAVCSGSSLNHKPSLQGGAQEAKHDVHPSHISCPLSLRRGKISAAQSHTSSALLSFYIWSLQNGTLFWVIFKYLWKVELCHPRKRPFEYFGKLFIVSD